MDLTQYCAAVKAETVALSSKAAHEVRGWAEGWGRAFRALVDADAIYEVCPLIASRWEFLGCLLKGYQGSSSNMGHAVAYAAKFLVPINSRYGARHPSILPDRPISALLFDMLRNKALHGFTPAGVFDPKTASCITWLTTNKGARDQHLTFQGRHGSAIMVDAETLCDEFRRSMHAYADYLEANERTEKGSLPLDDFRTGVWWKFMPQGHAAGWGALY